MYKSIFVVMSKNGIILGEPSGKEVEIPQIPIEIYKKFLKEDTIYGGYVKFPSGNNLVIAKEEGKEYYVFILKDPNSPSTKFHLTLPAGYPEKEDFVYDNGGIDIEKTLRKTAEREFKEELGFGGKEKVKDIDPTRNTVIDPYFSDSIPRMVCIELGPRGKFWDKEKGPDGKELNRPAILVEKNTFHEADYGDMIPVIAFSGYPPTRWESELPLTVYGITALVKDRENWPEIILEIIHRAEYYEKNKNNSNLLGLPESNDMYTKALYAWFIDHPKARNKLEEFFRVMK